MGRLSDMSVESAVDHLVKLGTESGVAVPWPSADAEYGSDEQVKPGLLSGLTGKLLGASVAGLGGLAAWYAMPKEKREEIVDTARRAAEQYTERVQESKAMAEASEEGSGGPKVRGYEGRGAPVAAGAAGTLMSAKDVLESHLKNRFPAVRKNISGDSIWTTLHKAPIRGYYGAKRLVTGKGPAGQMLDDLATRRSRWLRAAWPLLLAHEIARAGSPVTEVKQ